MSVGIFDSQAPTKNMLTYYVNLLGKANIRFKSLNNLEMKKVADK